MHYTYSMLVEDLLLGHEFEFTYKGKTYGIITLHKGNVLCTGNKAISHYYEDVLELLSEVKIEGRSIEEVFNDADNYYAVH
jgi:hypothetical protein